MQVFGDICGGQRGRGVYGILLNYQSSLAAMGSAMHEAPYQSPPRAPVLYIKPANTWTCAGAPIPLPAGETCIEVGATLGIVLGRTTVRASESGALAHVAGFIVVNDVCLPHTNVYRPALKQRCRDSFCALGSDVVAVHDIPDLEAIAIRSYVNGALCLEVSTGELVRGIPRLIADVSEFMTLLAGDVLLVGVPMGAPRAFNADLVRVEVEGVGVIENRVISQAAHVRRGVV